MAPTWSRPPAGIHVLCQTYKKDIITRRDTKPLQSRNKCFLVWGTIGYWRWASSIKASFGEHATAVIDGKKKSVLMQVFLSDNWKASANTSVPRLRVDGSVWPRWRFIKQTSQMALPWKPAITYLQLQAHSHPDGSKVQILTERLQMMKTVWWDGFLTKLVLSSAGILFHTVQSCYDWSDGSLAVRCWQ